MDIQDIVAQLREELGRIEHAIAALTGSATRRGPGRPAGSKNAGPAAGQKRRRMSASARARIAAAKKAWWAKQRGKAASKKVAPKRKPMSPAARKKLSALMKARWAAKKKAA
jgi:hypothetical protein